MSLGGAMSNLNLGALVREYRLKADMTQSDLAKKLGYESVQFVSLFERGLSKIPINVLGQLIVILGISEKKILNTLLSEYELKVKNLIADGKKKSAY